MMTAEEVFNLQEKISNRKKDIEFLSKKVGVHHMYLNRLNKERVEEEELSHVQNKRNDGE